MNAPNETGYAKRIRAALTWQNVAIVVVVVAILVAIGILFGLIPL